MPDQIRVDVVLNAQPIVLTTPPPPPPPLPAQPAPIESHPPAEPAEPAELAEPVEPVEPEGAVEADEAVEAEAEVAPEAEEVQSTVVFEKPKGGKNARHAKQNETDGDDQEKEKLEKKGTSCCAECGGMAKDGFLRLF